MSNLGAYNPARVVGHSIALFFLGLLMSAFSARFPQTAEWGNRIVAEVVTPVQNLVGLVDRTVSGVWSGYVWLVDVKRTNVELRHRLSALEAENSRLLEFESENERLRNLMGLVKQQKLEGISANVIGYDPSNWVKSITINKGYEDGVMKGMSVVEGKGVVGHVISTTRRSARILLVSDHASSIDAIIQRTRARGVVEGSGGRLARLSYVLEKEDVQIGDRIITSGLDGVYPKGLFIGIVSDVDPPARRLFHRIDVQPAVNLLKLEDVFIITSNQVEVEDTLESPEAVPAEKVKENEGAG